MKRVAFVVIALTVVVSPGCSSLFGGVPNAPPPLLDMEEPLAIQQEPDDEAARRALPKGGFTGTYVGEAGVADGDMLGDPEGVVVTRVVENSPADAAGLVEGDILLEVTGVPGRDEASGLRWPSEWRDLELACVVGTKLGILYDRAGVEMETTLLVAERVRHPGRIDSERFREEKRVGVVVRTATEVEARTAGLGPGGGAVVIGLSRRSPWRLVGVRFGDLIVGLDDQPLSHPQELMRAIRELEADGALALALRRENESVEIQAPVSRRRTDLTEIFVPPLFSYESDADNSDFSILFGLFGYETTSAAWQLTFLWFITFSGGDADELEVIEP